MRQKPNSIKAAWISAIAVIIAAIIGLFFSNKQDIKSTKKISNTTDSHSIIMTDNQNEINGDFVNGDKITINKTEIESQESIKKTDNRIQYQLVGVTNFNLIADIEKSGRIRIVNKSENEIIIYYSGSIDLLYPGTNSYNYEGGYVKVKIGNNCILNFEDFKILPIRANPKEIIEIEIQNIINDYINKNTSLVSQKIQKCINP